MFTKNWYKALTAEIYNSSDVTGINTSGAVQKFMKNSSATGGVYPHTAPILMGGSELLASNNNVPYIGSVRTSLINGGVIFGDGDTTPTLNDYNLAGNLITSISASVITNAVTNDDGCTLNCIYTITNSGSEAITIKEIGLVMKSTTSYTYLLERTVLESPVTIEPGGVGQVNYTITFTYPTA